MVERDEGNGEKIGEKRGWSICEREIKGMVRIWVEGGGGNGEENGRGR